MNLDNERGLYIVDFVTSSEVSCSSASNIRMCGASQLGSCIEPVENSPLPR